MTTSTLETIKVAIRGGETTRARELLREELRNRPSADAWYLAARVARTPEQSVEFCRRAIDLDPFHENASRLLAHVQSLKNPQPPINTLAASQLQPSVAPRLLTDAMVIFGNKGWSLLMSTPEMVQFEKQKGINSLVAFLLIIFLGLFGSLIAVIGITSAKAERITLRVDASGQLITSSPGSRGRYRMLDVRVVTNLADSVQTGTHSIAGVIALGLVSSWCGYMALFGFLIY